MFKDRVVRQVTRSAVGFEGFKQQWQRAGGALEDFPQWTDSSAQWVSDSTASPIPAGTPGPKRCPVPCDWWWREFEKWSALRVQGVGVGVFAGDRTSNSWVRDPTSWVSLRVSILQPCNCVPTYIPLARLPHGGDPKGTQSLDSAMTLADPSSTSSLHALLSLVTGPGDITRCAT